MSEAVQEIIKKTKQTQSVSAATFMYVPALNLYI